jgi:Calx-beta domain-containing protein
LTPCYGDYHVKQGMGDSARIGSLARGALVALLATSVAISGVASAASTSAAAAPVVSKVRARALTSTGATTSWMLTARAVDRDGDLVGGQVRIKVGAKGKVLSRRIARARSRSASSHANTAVAGIKSATLAGSSLRVVFFSGAPPGPLTVTFWASDAQRHSTKRVVLFLKVKATQTVTIAASNPSAAEPSVAATLTVTRTGGTTAAPLTVAYTIAGTATSGSDYTALPGSVTIPARQRSATISVRPIDDETLEPSESVIATVAARPSYIVGTASSATVTITDDDVLPTVTVTATDAAAAEPSDPGVFTVTRTESTTTSLVVSYTAAGTATAGSDYTTVSGSLTIPAGASTARITVTPTDDTTVESAETVLVTLRASSRYTIGTPSTATVTITDDDVQSAVTVVATGAAATEPSSTGTFTVTRTGSTTTALTVSFALGGTATNGSDYSIQPSSPLTIPAGASSATITVTPIDDAIVESSETVVATLTTGTGYTVGSPSSATVTIADDEPTVTITATDAAAAEPSDAGTFTVTRTGSTTAALTVFYTVSGTATNGTDYTTLPGSVTISAGQSSATITVSPIDDPTAEPGGETVIVTLVGASNYSVGTPSAATATIADND